MFALELRSLLCYHVRVMSLRLVLVAATALLLADCQSTVTLPAGSPTVAVMPTELCYLDEVAPLIRVDLKYCGSDNFVGRTVDGYQNGRRAVLRRDTAEALRRASENLAKQGLGLLVWDAYRPARAMRDFRAWSRTADESTKAVFYPNITKQGIYDGRYIGTASEHSWGIAVDITLIDLQNGQELDMGGRHDLLDVSSATRSPLVSAKQRANRLKLRDAMAAVGMRNYSKEWWHYFLSPSGTCHVYDFPLDDNMRTSSH